MDTDTSTLHVQVSMAQQDIHYLLIGLYSIGRGKQLSDDPMLRLQLGVSDLMSAFQNSLYFLVLPDNVF
jgi:hypothetical protein